MTKAEIKRQNKRTTAEIKNSYLITHQEEWEKYIHTYWDALREIWADKKHSTTTDYQTLKKHKLGTFFVNCYKPLKFDWDYNLTQLNKNYKSIKVK